MDRHGDGGPQLPGGRAPAHRGWDPHRARGVGRGRGRAHRLPLLPPGAPHHRGDHERERGCRPGGVNRLRADAPPAVRWIVRKLEDAGFETWAVGGAVRDALLGLPGGDWDLATRARPGDVRRFFRRTVPLGIEHGTVGVLSDDGAMYEVPTFRRDVATDGRHAVVAFAESLEEDLARRDFTINAVAWHPLRDEVRDPFGGVQDLDARLLRAVGAPGQRFAEDYLRILRALRFASRFGLAGETATWGALRAGVEKLRELSAERIREELLKVLEADRVPSRALELYRGSGTLGVLYPELEDLANRDPAGWAAALAALDGLPIRRAFLRLAALLRPLDPGKAAQVLVRLRLSNVQVDMAARRASAPPLPAAGLPDAEFRRWLSAVGPAHLSAVARLDLAASRAEGASRSAAEVVAAWRHARRVLGAHPPLAVGDLAVDGRDLIALGLRPGPRFGEILEALLERVLEDPSRNGRAFLLAEAARMAGEGGAHG
ncbi:MAG: CCA tRNA nucleotidyltransferase [Gemmatimonadetes bacterium]|nr:CCA tRNA nucleotidyltransferase [Gemmatimonadota bacterium]